MLKRKKPSWRGTSSKTRIETILESKITFNFPPVEEVLPVKQGLKRDVLASIENLGYVEEVLPVKQGLKLSHA